LELTGKERPLLQSPVAAQRNISSLWEECEPAADHDGENSERSSLIRSRRIHSGWPCWPHRRFRRKVRRSIILSYTDVSEE